MAELFDWADLDESDFLSTGLESSVPVISWSSCASTLLWRRVRLGATVTLRTGGGAVVDVFTGFGGPGAIGTAPPFVAAAATTLLMPLTPLPPPLEVVDLGDSELVGVLFTTDIGGS
jgi:hypothetical protein